MAPISHIPQSALTSLRRRWMVFTLLSFSAAVAGYLLLRNIWQPFYALRWLGLTCVALGYLSWVFWRGLEHNHRAGERVLLPTLGAGNLMTLLRGAFIAALVGFLFSPRPSGWLAWVPGILYILADIADYLDGYLARVTNHATRLGETLDMSFDGAGVLAAAWLAVQYGQVPLWYISVGLARVLFILGSWLRAYSGKPVYDLPSNAGRRALAGVQMGFIAIVLLPLFSPPGTHLAAIFFALPFLAGFLRDWFITSGFIRPARRRASNLQALLSHWFPLLLRLASAVISLYLFSDHFPYYIQSASLSPILGTPPGGTDAFMLGVIEAGVALLILLGIAGRISAILGLCLIAYSQIFTSLSPGQIFLIFAYSAILLMGTGALSLWTPENHLIYHRAGEARIMAPSSDFE